MNYAEKIVLVDVLSADLGYGEGRWMLVLRVRHGMTGKIGHIFSDPQKSPPPSTPMLVFDNTVVWRPFSRGWFDRSFDRTYGVAVVSDVAQQRNARSSGL